MAIKEIRVKIQTKSNGFERVRGEVSETLALEKLLRGSRGISFFKVMTVYN